MAIRLDHNHTHTAGNFSGILKFMNIISSSYGNDSIALIRWARDNDLPDVTVAYCATGWAAPDWLERVERGEDFARSLGFKVVRIQSMGFEDLVRMKKGFPANQYQFCTAHLKGIPFLNWIDEIDPKREAVVLIGKRRAESKKRANTPEFLISEYHGDRKVWHPLYKHTDQQRNYLLDTARFEVLPHRSQECSPCVNANRSDFLLLTKSQIERVSALEVEIGKPMFRPKRFGAVGIYGVMAWAKYGKNNKNLLDEELLEDEGCGSPFGCGL